MIRLLPTVLLVATAWGSAVASAAAAPATVGVRVEGREQTLFEGPVQSTGGEVRAASDARRRTCDGTNLGANPLPGPTATGAAVEGMRIAGFDFDGTWTPAFDDYFMTRFGPDAQDAAAQDYWGVLVDADLVDVGGCQVQVRDGTRVLWAYDAFRTRGFLKLAAAGDTGAAPNPFATTVVGQPLTVRVTFGWGRASQPSTPIGDVAVAPVATAANGVQSIATGAPEAVRTAADGTADLTFASAGWHRVKADGGADGPIRSNRLDICVTAAPGGDCGPPPADTGTRVAPPLPPDPVVPGATGGTGGASTGDGGRAPPSAVGAPVIELPRFNAAGARSGRIGLSWRILQPGAGVREWRFAARLAGARRAPYVTRSRGRAGTSALLALPAGRTWSVRATFVDTLGRSVSETVGDVLVPLDAGARGVRRDGAWRRGADRGAWLGSVHRGGRGARLTARLAAGRPVVLLRGVRRTADVEVRAGSHRAVYRVAGSTTAATRELVAPWRARSGVVTVRVVAGEVGIDGVGVRP
ncbi:hypothetical protein [Conexibacter woesei]|uniref:DUF4430 domain-containing protein n=1 Tax=Conexibacter woesei (strain DSM 14684 / CCUG 47730 / CIP 108061 / JCM 11494 / NBRC 100937 / ID131577) TaxID=469383 RepID=D3F169_CONWI|nr:hypothetical protein [Conexibacter woesei]ADB50145.1 hypothetical protein Cwoe_1718 [Conexibacter woesei DSM 14684]